MYQPQTFTKKSFLEKSLEEKNISGEKPGHLSKTKKAKLIQQKKRKQEEKKRQKERMLDRFEKTIENTNESSLVEQQESLLKHTKEQDAHIEKECAEREQSFLRTFLIEFYKRSKQQEKLLEKAKKQREKREEELARKKHERQMFIERYEEAFDNSVSKQFKKYRKSKPIDTQKMKRKLEEKEDKKVQNIKEKKIQSITREDKNPICKTQFNKGYEELNEFDHDEIHFEPYKESDDYYYNIYEDSCDYIDSNETNNYNSYSLISNPDEFIKRNVNYSQKIYDIHDRIVECEKHIQKTKHFIQLCNEKAKSFDKEAQISQFEIQELEKQKKLVVEENLNSNLLSRNQLAQYQYEYFVEEFEKQNDMYDSFYKKKLPYQVRRYSEYSDVYSSDTDNEDYNDYFDY